jgi:hypothetical protein
MYLRGGQHRIGVFAFVFALPVNGRMFAGVTANISGTVKDSSGASIAGANVTATNTGTGITETRTSNAKGFFSFQSLALGTYVVAVIKFGGQFHFSQLEQNLSNVANGNYFFGSAFSGQPSETGSDFVDFLLGAPASYVQGQSYPSYGQSLGVCVVRLGEPR